MSQNAKYKSAPSQQQQCKWQRDFAESYELRIKAELEVRLPGPA
jgi:hypothetical protein